MPMDTSQREKNKFLEALVAIDVMLQARFL